MMDFVSELWRFMRVRKKFWLLPILVMMVVFGGLVVLTSRVSVEMVQKSAFIRAPLIAAISAPTALAIRTADAAGITLVAIARGDGPASAILALGYAGWAPGQLEEEIQKNGWLHCAADSELIFGTDIGGKYDLALKKIGIDLGMLSNEAGHA